MAIEAETSLINVSDSATDEFYARCGILNRAELDVERRAITSSR